MRRRQQGPETEDEQPRRRGLHSPGVWLATLSTVVGVATGMFTLRDQVFPGERGSAVAVSIPAYQHEVGAVCDELNENDEARAEEDERLATALQDADTNPAQRDALLESVRRVSSRSSHTLTAFAALETPDTLSAVQQDAERAWQRNLDRLRDYATALDQAETRADVLAAVDDLSDQRTPLARDGEVLRTGLTKLGSESCDLEAPIVTATLTLPPLPEDDDGSGVTDATRSANSPSDGGGTAPQPTAKADGGGSGGSGGSSEPEVTGASVNVPGPSIVPNDEPSVESSSAPEPAPAGSPENDEGASGP